MEESVIDVGHYFPFVNRDKSLKLLWTKLKESIYWAKNHRGNPDSYRVTGANFIAICGTAGLGKTTFATDGLLKISQCIDSIDPPADQSDVQLLKECIQR